MAISRHWHCHRSWIRRILDFGRHMCTQYTLPVIANSRTVRTKVHRRLYVIVYIQIAILRSSIFKAIYAFPVPDNWQVYTWTGMAQSLVAGDRTPVSHCYAMDLSYNADYIHIDSSGHRMQTLTPRWAPRWAHILWPTLPKHESY